MFADVLLARRIESADCRLIGAAAEAHRARTGSDSVMARPLGGGLAVFTSPGAPWNKIAGLGFAPLEEADLAEVEREMARRGSAVQVEFAALGDNTICTMLTRRGYDLVAFENVLGLRLGPRHVETPPSISITPVVGGELRTWTDSVITGFEHPDPSQGPKAHESFTREQLEDVHADMAKVPGVRHYLARVDGQAAGGGALRLSEGIAQLCGAATLPAFRRRGVQTALLEARLRDASFEGCEVAVVTTQPGSKSQENAQRRGFVLLYTRAILVRPPDR